MKIGVRRPQGTQLSQQERDKELIARGYTIEYTPQGRIVSPPKK